VRLFALTFCSVGVGVSHAGDYRMSLSSIILGHDGQKRPYSVVVTYSDGSVGRLPMFADDMRDCLRMTRELLPLHLPARSVLITERVKK
jgi:hypothetical protein